MTGCGFSSQKEISKEEFQGMCDSLEYHEYQKAIIDYHLKDVSNDETIFDNKGQFSLVFKNGNWVEEDPNNLAHPAFTPGSLYGFDTSKNDNSMYDEISYYKKPLGIRFLIDHKTESLKDYNSLTVRYDDKYGFVTEMKYEVKYKKEGTSYSTLENYRIKYK